MEILRRPDYKKNSIILIAVVSIIKWIIAASTELGNDEAYYWLYSQQLQWNYFDHPPMVAVWIRIFTGNLLLQDYEGFIRSGSVAGSAISSWFIFKMVSRIHSERAGFFAVCLYQSSLYAGITAGLYILPDSSQMVFWTLSLWMISRLFTGDERLKNWVLLGIASGLCIMSKVHGIFIWLGFGACILMYQRPWLRKPELYISFLISFLIIVPIITWNLGNDFISYRFHSNRVTIQQFSPQFLIQEILAQIFFNNPFNVLLIIAGICSLSRQLIKKIPVLKLFLFIGLPLPLILLIISLTRETLPHWSGPGYVTLLPIAAIALAERKKIHFPDILKLSQAFFILVLAAGTFLVKFYPGTIGSQKKQELGKGDPSLDMFGWKKAGELFNLYYQEGVKHGKINPRTPVICFAWPGAHVEYYFCRPGRIPMVGLGTIENLHQYAWMQRTYGAYINMNEAFYITSSDEKWNALPLIQTYYSSVEKLKIIETIRNGKPAHDFIIYRLRGLSGN